MCSEGSGDSTARTNPTQRITPWREDRLSHHALLAHQYGQRFSECFPDFVHRYTLNVAPQSELTGGEERLRDPIVAKVSTERQAAVSGACRDWRRLSQHDSAVGSALTCRARHEQTGSSRRMRSSVHADCFCMRMLPSPNFLTSLIENSLLIRFPD